jgi:alkanesulfonate monooxygenase SsuD/methylene tetrahydromethanopterin reductase-like flavin-dependent oxidoreductase (luciferase family)
VDVSGFGSAGERIRAAFASRDFDAMAAAVPEAMVDAMSAAGTPAQVAAKLEEFSRHVPSSRRALPADPPRPP